MHEGHYEDGSLVTCWGCGIEHYTLEDVYPRDGHWTLLCEQCLVEYDEGKERGVLAVQAGRSDFERRGMPSVMRSGYMTGRFLAAAGARRTKVAASQQRRGSVHPWIEADVRTFG